MARRRLVFRTYFSFFSSLSHAYACAVVAGALMVLAAGCKFSPGLPEGEFRCDQSTTCPQGLSVCFEGLCYSTNPAGGGTGGRSGTGGNGGGGQGGAMSSTPGGNGGSGSGGGGGSSGGDALSPTDAGSNPDLSAPKPDVAVDRPSSDAAPAMDAIPVHDVRPPMEVATPVDWPECTPPAAPNLPLGLLAHLRLDESGTSPVLADSSPNKLDATATGLGAGGATWVSGRLRGALSLTGGVNGGSVKVGGTHLLNSAYEGFTFSTWARFPQGTPGNGVIASRRAEGPYGYLYRISVAGGRLRVQLHTANGSNADLTSDQVLPTNGRWMHIAVVYATIPGSVALFVNGASFGSVKFSLQLGPENTPLVIGGAESIVRPPPGTIPPPITIIDRLPGALDEVSFFRRALTAPEVMALACGTLPVP
jgi:hypothetical protein